MDEIMQWYERDFTLEQAMDNIDASLRASVRNFVAVGFYLKTIRDRKLYQEADYKNFEEFVRDKYDRDKGWASRCIKVNDQLSKDGNSPLLAEDYKDYKVSQLVELAYLTEEQRILASPDMTVKEIQAIRKPEPEEQPEPEVVISQLEGDEEQEEDCVPTKQPLHVDEYVKLFWDEMYPSVQALAEKRDRTITKILQKEYGACYHGSCSTNLNYDCSPKGIEFDRLDCADPVKLTWGKLTDRIFALLDAGEIKVEESKKVTISQPVVPDQEEQLKPVQEDISPDPVLDENSCPPGDWNCRRQEWGIGQKEQEIGHLECVKCWDEWKKRKKLLDAAALHQEITETEELPVEPPKELTPMERGCITGLSPHGNCVCCGADGVKCCGQCNEDCNGRCGWLDKQELEQSAPKMEHELRGKYCDAAARKLIESKHGWFTANHMNRVLQVNESEKQLKEQLVGKEAWYFTDPCGNGIAHMNLFQDYIQFFDGDSWVGDCEWFYLCAAIQGMWNVIAIENIQAELHEKENKPELCKEEPQPKPENDQPDKVIDAVFTEIKPEPAKYDKDIMKEMVDQEEQMLSELGENWKKNRPYYYTKHTMMLEAYRMLQAAHEMEV